MNHKFFLCSLVITFCLMLSACAGGNFGVSDERWQQMSETERQTAIEGYNERQRIIALRQLAAEERAAADAESRRLDAQAQSIITEQKIAAIYAGDAGNYGDLIRVSLSGGQISFFGKHRDYQPVSFKMADGELKMIPVHRQGHRSQTTELWVSYFEGNLLFDVGEYGRKEAHAKHIVFQPEWRSGQTYHDISLDKHTRSEAQHINLTIQIIPALSHRNHY